MNISLKSGVLIAVGLAVIAGTLTVMGMIAGTLNLMGS